MMCLFPLTNLLHTLNKGFVIDGIVISRDAGYDKYSKSVFI